MKQHVLFPLFVVALLSPSEAARRGPQSVESRSVTSQATPTALTSAHPDDSDSIVIPDGTPIPIEVMAGDPCNKLSVGDVIEVRVAFALRAAGLIIMPHGMHLTGRVAATCPYVPQPASPRFDAPPAEVVVAFDEFKLPSGESGRLRLSQKPSTNAEKTGADLRYYRAPNQLLFGSYFYKAKLFVGKQTEIEVVYLNGPLRVSRKAVMQVQSGAASVSAYVLADGLPYLACGQRFWSLEDDNGPHIVQLELSPGTYWFSTDAYIGKMKKQPRMRKVKAELLANHEYQVQLDKNHELTMKELNERTSSGHFVGYDVPYHPYVGPDLTSLNVEENRLLALEPITKPHL